MELTRKERRVTWPVMEYFYTVQGEGFYSGRAAFFIRLGGCDVGCVWCDVKESWNAEDHPEKTLEELIEAVGKTPAELVVITGGEPAMYDLSELVDALKKGGKEVAIETSGCYELSGNVDWYCFSPKKFKDPVEEAYDKADELKIVIYHKSDFQWAEGHAAKVNKGAELFLQPEWSKQAQILPQIINFVKEHPKWRISLQTHKFMNIP
ncbi:MAG: 7-carboxy-7-deazaguanine synthase QueE [Brumimicrobium sp.]|nr:7-carboxy-7-deazaguanine synthase QueE [Brumimicrobium sp.]